MDRWSQTDRRVTRKMQWKLRNVFFIGPFRNGTHFCFSYWNDGEPNNQGNEDCAAAYPRSNPFKSWNDAPCQYDLKWICQMLPSVSPST